MGTSGSSKGSRRSTKTTSQRKSGSHGREKKPIASSSNSGVDRPFDVAVLQRARDAAVAYRLLLRGEDDGYSATAVEMPEVVGFGDTLAGAADEAIELLVSTIAVMIENGDAIPAPLSGKRDQQVNIRLTAEEKLRLEAAAQRDGFRSISDFLRTAGLGRAS